MEEAKECISGWDLKLDGLWKVIREGESVPLHLFILEHRKVLSEEDGVSMILEDANRLITEAVQVAAMCEKYLKFLELEGENANANANE